MQAIYSCTWSLDLFYCLHFYVWIALKRAIKKIYWTFYQLCIMILLITLLILYQNINWISTDTNIQEPDLKLSQKILGDFCLTAEEALKPNVTENKELPMKMRKQEQLFQNYVLMNWKVYQQITLELKETFQILIVNWRLDKKAVIASSKQKP